MAKIEIARTELVWPGKYDEKGELVPPRRVHLPFQVIERVNETRATREQREEALQGHVGTLFDYWQFDEGQSASPDGDWRNKLIWGDNLYVMGSLLEHFAGKVDLIYIDPPFATGADFSFTSRIGDDEDELLIGKEQSIIEEKAYRDTWGKGIASYLQMMYERFILMYDLLSLNGSLYVHCDTRVNSALRLILDEVFGEGSFVNQITWRRTGAHNDPGRYGMITDTIFFYAKNDGYCWNQPYGERSQEAIERSFCYAEKPDGSYIRIKSGQQIPDNWRRFQSVTLRSPHPRPNLMYEYKGYKPHRNGWSVSLERMQKYDRENRLIFPNNPNGAIRLKMYLDESPGLPVQDIWTDIGKIEAISLEALDYATQKPEALLKRIIGASSDEDDLVADFFCGSGTTLAVAEKLGRRWIGCDLGRYAIHTTRKRLMDIPDCRPFEILNLGQYERQVWQGVAFGGQRRTEQMLIYEYLKFILDLYGAQPLPGTQHLHGKKGAAMVHVGAVDAPVTIDEVLACLAECRAMGQRELHVLGWEWEMGLSNLVVDEARGQGIRLLLLTIPREVMEQQAVDKGDIHFYELAYLEVEIKPSRKKRSYTVALTDFVIPNDELIPPEVRRKIAKWSDYVDYWAVDWDFRNDTFLNGWTSYRTRRDRTLQLKSDSHVYEAPGRYRVLVKVIDIFGNDTSQVYEVQVE